MNALITELLTPSMAKYATYRRKNTYSKIINVADCQPSKKRLLAVKYLILIIYHYPTVKTGRLYKSTDEPGVRPANNPPNSDGLEDLHWTVPESTVQVYWRPGPPIWQPFDSDPDPNPKWLSGTVANTIYYNFTSMHEMSYRTDYLTCSWRVNIWEPVVCITVSLLSGISWVRSPSVLNLTAMALPRFLNTPLLTVMNSSTNELVFIRDLSNLTLQIIFDTW